MSQINRIVFLAGKNARRGGVVDYLTRLCGEIVRQSEGQIRTQICFSVEEIGRLGAGDIFSLQYVPHGFQSRGLPFALPQALADFLDRTPSHIMFHEIWTGIDAHDRIQNKLLRPAMQVIALRLVRKLKPIAIHTSNPFYQGRLRAVGIRAGILPILSNIAIADRNLEPEASDGTWRFATFGGFDPRWDGRVWMAKLRAELEASSTRATFVSIGRQGAAISKLEAACAKYPELLSFAQLGELPEKQVSIELSRSHAGMVSTAAHFLGRSGAFAAMVSHGLPVFATNPGLVRFAVRSPQLLVGLSNGALLQHAAKSFERRDILPEVCDAFLSSLARAY